MLREKQVGMSVCRRVATVLVAVLLFVGSGEVFSQEELPLVNGLRIRLAKDWPFPVTSSGEKITGRLYLFTTKKAGTDPRQGPNWFSPEPFYGRDVREVAPGDSRDLDDQWDGFPGKLSELEPGDYYVQALLDRDFYASDHNRGVGNFYSKVHHVHWVGAGGKGGEAKEKKPIALELVLDQVINERSFPESKWVKELKIYSPRLSLFHGREVLTDCAVSLPASYFDEPIRRYPVIYVVSGFGGTYTSMARRYQDGAPPAEKGEAEFIRILLDGQCKWGHHVYADSATNGPRGASLVHEMIPEIDQRFRTVAASTARFVTGHSSGGWSSLWLQVNYPDTFGGVWSTSPDPVDFRDYQQVNLYARPPLSLYFNEENERRPIARQGTRPVLWYESFGRMDDCLGRGGQLKSFEAAFSPLDERGLPRLLWDRKKGVVDPNVAQAWRNYDINILLQRRWKQLEPKLRGKLHVSMGELDTFYLEGAVVQMMKTLETLKSDAKVEILEGKNHGNVRTAALVKRHRLQMSERFFRDHPEHRPQE